MSRIFELLLNLLKTYCSAPKSVRNSYRKSGFSLDQLAIDLLLSRVESIGGPVCQIFLGNGKGGPPSVLVVDLCAATEASRWMDATDTLLRVTSQNIHAPPSAESKYKNLGDGDKKSRLAPRTNCI